MWQDKHHTRPIPSTHKGSEGTEAAQGKNQAGITRSHQVGNKEFHHTVHD
jgi:phosphoketolase